MKFVIIGSGLMGVTTAYLLGREGHQVTVVDREQGPGRETSFANGSLLTPSMPEPWNAPGCWRMLLSSLVRSNTALQLRWSAVPALASWGVTFLKNSAQPYFQRNAIKNLQLALYSLEVMASLLREIDIEYERSTCGTLRLFRTRSALDRATASAKWLSSQGLSFQPLSVSETLDLEPALAPISAQLVGALHYGVDQSGDAHRFCVALAEESRKLGVQFHFGVEVSFLQMCANRISAAVVSSGESFSGDRYIVAAGSYTALLLRSVGLRVPVRPVKGYSITFPKPSGSSVRVPVLDDEWHAAVVPLGDRLRVAGTAEFSGYNRSLNRNRIHNLQALLGRILPEMHLEPETAQPWCGLRPMSADGVPIIGSTPLPNLFVNTGHGPLGWTMAAGSAQLLVDIVTDNSPAVDESAYSLKRFTS